MGCPSFGHHFKDQQMKTSMWHRAALSLDSTPEAARNNLAMTLLDLGCPQAARTQVDGISPERLTGEPAESVADTRKQIEAAPTLLTQRCVPRTSYPNGRTAALPSQSTEAFQ
jgi:hypothetical protein